MSGALMVLFARLESLGNAIRAWHRSDAEFQFDRVLRAAQKLDRLGIVGPSAVRCSMHGSGCAPVLHL